VRAAKWQVLLRASAEVEDGQTGRASGAACRIGAHDQQLRAISTERDPVLVRVAREWPRARCATRRVEVEQDATLEGQQQAPVGAQGGIVRLAKAARPSGASGSACVARVDVFTRLSVNESWSTE
jgi:hypothetical protein